MVNKFLWLTKDIFQLHSQVDGIGRELEKSIRSSVIMVYACVSLWITCYAHLFIHMRHAYINLAQTTK